MSWRDYTYHLLAEEVTASAAYFDQVRHHSNSGARSSALVELVPERPTVRPVDGEPCVAHLLDGTFNYCDDIEALLGELGRSMRRRDRVLVVVYNSYLDWAYRIADWLKLRSGPAPTTFLTLAALHGLARLSGFELVRYRPCAYVPWRLLGLGALLNKLLPAVPLLRRLAFTGVITLRPVRPEVERPSLSIVIPARNERGNIEAAIRRLPNVGADTEVIFVEGHSTDETWEEILRVQAGYRGPLRIHALRQPGHGKADAVRAGFAASRNTLLVILDADLAMPPELLPRFYDAWCRGIGDFINGNRLLYPMEGSAMRFLNRVGNICFAKMLSYVLDTTIGDSLCGTKLLARSDWLRCQRWHEDFGEFDPFGDFALLFPAAVLGLGVADVPIRYRDRAYGTTNIHRFRHGWMLLRMTLVGFFRVRLGRTS